MDIKKALVQNITPFLVVFLVSLSLSAASAQTTWHVATNGADSGNDGRSWGQPFLTISNAVVKASATLQDTILVSNGTYAIIAQISIAKPVTITGVNGWTNTTVIGNATFGCFNIANTSAVLRGFTITNGLASYGGGVSLDNGAVHDCLITGNKASRGGGVSLSAAPIYSMVSNCIIRSNLVNSNVSWSAGGGVYMRGGKLVDCLIDYNSNTNTATYGGGVNVESGEYMSGCTIKNNTAYGSGGGIYVVGAFALTNCSVDNNYANTYGGGIYVSAALTIVGGSVNSNTIGSYYGAGINVPAGSRLIVSNASISYNYLTNAWGGAGIDFAGTEAVFDNCDISYNRTTCLPVSRQQYGGGMYFRGSNLTVRNSRLVDNAISNINNVMGGAIYSPNNKGSVLIENCVIKSNAITAGAATSSGGGLYLSSNAIVRNCELSGNCASLRTDVAGVGYGGGIYVANTNCANVIESCTIADNYARNSGAGIYLTGNGLDEVWNCVVQSNSYSSGMTNWYFGNTARTNKVYFTCTPQLMGGGGNITGDPQFADFAGHNFRLVNNSPCVNSGTNQSWMTDSVDLDERNRIRYGTVDMGAYELIYDGTIYNVR